MSGPGPRYGSRRRDHTAPNLGLVLPSNHANMSLPDMFQDQLDNTMNGFYGQQLLTADSRMMFAASDQSGDYFDTQYTDEITAPSDSYFDNSAYQDPLDSVDTYSFEFSNGSSPEYITNTSSGFDSANFLNLST